ncbi:hypothetical protein V6L78_24565 [Pseudomonas canadensis]
MKTVEQYDFKFASGAPQGHMLRASLLANAEILPQARQGSYFFNRIGR